MQPHATQIVTGGVKIRKPSDHDTASAAIIADRPTEGQTLDDRAAAEMIETVHITGHYPKRDDGQRVYRYYAFFSFSDS